MDFNKAAQFREALSRLDRDGENKGAENPERGRRRLPDTRQFHVWQCSIVDSLAERRFE
jgi:hypothetical protein